MLADVPGRIEASNCSETSRLSIVWKASNFKGNSAKGLRSRDMMTEVQNQPPLRSVTGIVKFIRGLTNSPRICMFLRWRLKQKKRASIPVSNRRAFSRCIVCVERFVT